MDDEQAIRDLIAAWQRASARNDLDALLPLMAEDVVFLVSGQPPMRGRDRFAAAFREIGSKVRIESSSDIQEIRVIGDWAYCWNHLSVTTVPLQGGAATQRAGYTLTIFQRQADGAWVILRDANLLSIAGSPS